MKAIIDKNIFRILIDEFTVRFEFDIELEGNRNQKQIYRLDHIDKIKKFLNFLEGKSHVFIHENLLISKDLFWLNIRLGNYYKSSLEIPLLLSKQERVELIDNIKKLLPQ